MQYPTTAPAMAVAAPTPHRQPRPHPTIPPIYRIVAGTLGLICAGIALALLCSDALDSGHWTLEHAMMIGVVTITILAGKLFWAARKSRHWGAVAGFAGAFHSTVLGAPAGHMRDRACCRTPRQPRQRLRRAWDKHISASYWESGA